MSCETLDHVLGLVRSGVLRIDADGRIWRDKAIFHGILRSVVPRRAESIGGKGYLRVMVQMPDGSVHGVGAHRLVWTFLRGPIPDGMQINHRDLDKRNNHPDNLEVVTAEGNIQHSYANGRRKPWSIAQSAPADYKPGWRGKPLLTPELKAEIVAMRRSGALFREIAALYGCSISHVSRLCYAR